MMAEDGGSDGASKTGVPSIEILPIDIYYLLFRYLPPKDMLQCRQVCVRWKDVVDFLLREGSCWEQFCQREYKNVYKQAMWKTPNITNWFEVYRSLSLWPKLHLAKDTIDEFCHSDTINEEMRSAVVQANGVIMVHKRTRIVYHNLSTLEVARRKGFSGQYISVIELEDVVVMLELNTQLHVVNKPNHNWNSDLTLNTDEDDEISFGGVKLFIIGDRTVYFSTFHHNLYAFHLDDDKEAQPIPLPELLLVGIPEGLGALGYTDGCLYILTMTENMYMYVNGQVYLKFTLATVTNLMDCLYQHNMLENIDWRHYYILLERLKHKQHTGLLQYITKMQIYDNVFFIGTQSGVVRVYYKPFVNGQLDLTQFEPMKEYNFTARIDIPLLSVYPILNIEVTETKEGHTVLVCMPRKILVITYKHEFERPISRAVVPYVPMPSLMA